MFKPKKFFNNNKNKKKKFHNKNFKKINFNKKRKVFFFGQELKKKKKKKKINYLYKYKKIGIFYKKPIFNDILYTYPFNFKLINEILKK